MERFRISNVTRHPALVAVLRYALAFASGAAALGLSLTLVHYGLPRLFGVFSLAAIAIVFWFAGTGPGLLTILLSSLAFFFFLFPITEVRGPGWQSFIAIYVMFSGLAGWFSASRRRAERLLAQARDNLEKRVAERTSQLGRANEELKSTEDALRHSEEHLRLVIDTVPALIYTGRPDGSLDFFNQRWLDYAGVSLEDLLGWKWTAAIHPEDVAATVEKWRAAVATGKPFENESRLRRADGQYRWMFHRKVPLRDERGNIVKWYGSSVDIEDRKRAEDDLRRQKEILQKIFDNVPVMINFTGADGRIELVNREWERTTGWTLKEIREQNVDIFAETYPDPRCRRKVLESVAAAEGKFADFRARIRDGRVIDTSSARVRLSDGTTIGISRDVTERKQTEEALRESEQRYRNFISHSTEGVWRLELERPLPLDLPEEESVAWLLEYGYIAECNDAFAQNLGLHSSEEVEGRRLRDLLPASDEERIETIRSAARGGWQSRTIEFRGRDNKGNLKHLLRTETPIVENGKLARIWGLTRDLTELKRAEEALRRSEDRLRYIIDTIPTMAWSVRPDGTVDFLNRPWLDYSGLSLEQYVEDPTRPIHPEDIPRVLEKWRAHMAAGEPFEDEMRLRRADGEYRWFLLRTVPLRDEQGNIVKWYGSSVDIEDRKRAEEELRDSEERFRATFENAPVAMALVDVEGHPIKCNLALQKMLGYTEEELSRIAFTEFTHPDDRELDWGLYSELTAGKRDKYEIEKRYLKKDGGVVWGLLTVSLVKGKPGRPAYAVGMVQDVTERKRAEEELQRSHDQLRALARRLQRVREEERTKVAREIHDELGQALTAIKLDLSSLSRELPADQKQQSESILKLADETIQSVRRISTELRPAILDTLGLVPALEWATEEFEARTGTRCQLDLPQEDIVIDQESGTALFRIFQETLTNVARHAMATEVNVRLAKDNGNLSLEVHDNGEGISEDQLTAGESLGILGMRERALLLGGELVITGAPGRGTTVRVRIPAAAPS